MRGTTVKHGVMAGCLKEEGGGGGGGGGAVKRRKTNNHVASNLKSDPPPLLKMEVVKSDPDGPLGVSSSPIGSSGVGTPTMNGMDVKGNNNNNTVANHNAGGNTPQVKLELSNGEGDTKGEFPPAGCSNPPSGSPHGEAAELLAGCMMPCDVEGIKSEAMGGLGVAGDGGRPSSNDDLGVGEISCDATPPGIGAGGGMGIKSGAGVATTDAQYMQQQSQIFVFTTQLANRAAEAVLQGGHPNIVSFHCSQPQTKKLLEKHPLKTNQFARQNPAQWLNSLAMKGAKGAMKGPMMPNGPMPGAQGPSMSDMMPMGMPYEMGDSMMGPMGGMPHGMMGPGMAGPNAGPGMMGPRGPIGVGPGMISQMGPGGQRLQGMPGMKVPDDHLTPEQRMHREEQMAKLRHMQALLMPEMHSPHHPEGGPPTPSASSTSGMMPSCSQSSLVSQAGQCATQNTSGNCMRQSPVSCMGPSPGINQSPSMGMSPMGQSPRMGPSPNLNSGPGMIPGMGPSINPGPNMGPGMNSMMVHNMGPSSGMMGPGMIGPGGQMPMSSQSAMMNQGPGPGVMVMTQGSMPMIFSQGPNGPGCQIGPNGTGMRMMNPGGPQGMPHMIMGPNGPIAAQMEWQRMQVEFFENKRGKKGSGGRNSAGPDSPIGMMCNMPMGAMTGMGPMGSGAGMNQMGSGIGINQMGGGMGVNQMGSMGMNQMGSVGMNPGMNCGVPGMRPMCPGGPRSQGPPPPYHGPRPVGIGPLTSPGSPTMMCSIASPRMPGMGGPNVRMPQMMPVDSPRPMYPSSPPTPQSQPPIAASPSLIPKEQPVTSQNTATDMPFGRQLQSFAQQQQGQIMQPGQPLGMPGQMGKEPNLMPVPSPQQISYCTFEGQELTIQKKPNTSVRENDIISPLSSMMDADGGGMSRCISGPNTPLGGGPHTPLTPSSEGPRLGGPHTPDRYPEPASSMGMSGDKPPRFMGPSPQGLNGPPTSGPRTPSVDAYRFPIPSPKTPSVCSGNNTPAGNTPVGMDIGGGPPRFPQGVSPMQNHPVMSPMEMGMNARFPGPNGGPGPGMNKIGGFSLSPTKMMDMGGGGEFQNPAMANLPLNPNCSTPMALPQGPGKVFDPISSMAQMSQQLTSGGGSSPPPPNCQGGTVVSAPNPGPQMMGHPGGGSIPTGVGPQGGMMDPQCMMSMPPLASSPNMMQGGPGMNSPGGPPPHSISPSAIAMMGVRMGGPNPMVRMPNCPMGNPYGVGGPNGQGGKPNPNTPNTIQYLPARQQNCGPRGPPNLEFMPRFGGPNGDHKDPNSPMFVNNPSAMCGAPNVPMSMNAPCGPCGVPISGPMPGQMHSGPMCTMAGSMNASMGPMMSMSGMNGPFMSGPGGHMNMITNGSMGMGGPNGGMGMGGGGMNAPMVGPGGVMFGPGGPIMGPMNPNCPSMMGGIPMGGQMMVSRSGPQMMRGPSPGAMMPGDMYGMAPGPNMGMGPMQGGPMNNPGGQGQMMPSGMMYAGHKTSPVNMGPMGGGGPESAQPLPPSMTQSGGNFKNGQFMVPTTTDPHYAAQYHTFQQQLYATNTRGPGGMPMASMGPMQGVHMGGNPGGPMPSGPMGVPQGYPYNPK